MNRLVLPESTPPEWQFKYIDISQVSSLGEISIPNESTTFESAPSRARRIADAGDTIVSTVRTYLRAIATVPDVDDRLIFSTGFAVLSPRGVEPRFLGYACRSSQFVHEVVGRSVGVSYPAIAPSDLLDIPIWMPGHDEQRRIADFLDDRVSRIDRIIAARRKQSDLLSQLARARLQASVSELVEQYAHTRLGRISKIRSGSFLPSEQFIEDGPFEVVGGNGVAGWFESTNVRAGTIAVGRVGALCGNVHLLTRDAWLTDNALGVELTDGLVEPEFLAAVLDSLNLNSLASQTAQPLLTGAQVADQPIPVGMTTEQTANVVKAWEALRSEAHMGLLQHSIDLLTEYKSALISAAVTGELDVSTAGSSIPG